jgi:hypothetical protein
MCARSCGSLSEGGEAVNGFRERIERILALFDQIDLYCNKGRVRKIAVNLLCRGLPGMY